MDDRRKALCALYGLIAFAALIATWSQNLAFFALPDGGGGLLGFIRAAGVNAAARSIGLDLGFFCLAGIVFMIVEAKRTGVRWVGVYIALSMLIAVSVMFPLFLIARERRLALAATHTAS